MTPKKTITINGQTYLLGAVQSVNGTTPDENGNIEIPTGGSAEGAVLYTKQELTDEQKSQARANIGAMQNGVSDTHLNMDNHSIFNATGLEIVGVDDHVYMACGARTEGSDGNYHAVLEYDDVDGLGVILRCVADGVNDMDVATVGQLNSAVGNISTALDHIIALQEELVGS